MKTHQTDNHKIFVKRLRELIGECSPPTQQAFAGKCRVDANAVHRWLNKEHMPSARALRAIVSTTGVSANWLLGLTDIRDAALDGMTWGRFKSRIEAQGIRDEDHIAFVEWSNHLESDPAIVNLQGDECGCGRTDDHGFGVRNLAS